MPKSHLVTFKEMAYPPGLVLHGKGYRVQKRIPQDCLKHFDGKTLLYHQTGLQDKKEAARVAWQWLALQEQEFERLRNPDKPLKSAISLAEMQGISGLHFWEVTIPRADAQNLELMQTKLRQRLVIVIN